LQAPVIVRPALFLALLLSAAVVVPGSVWAAASAARDDARQTSTQQLESALQTVENDARRAEFISTLKALIAARKSRQQGQNKTPAAGLQTMNLLSGRMDALSRDLLSAAESVLRLPQVLAQFSARLSDPQWTDAWLRLSGKLLLTLVGAWLLDRLVRRLLRRTREGIESRPVESLGLRIAYLFARTLLEVIPIAVFGVAAYFVLPFLEPGPQARAVTLALVDAVVVYRALMAVSRMLLTPVAVQLRLLPLSDMSAHYWFIWSRRLISIGVYGYFFTLAALVLGLPQGTHAVISKLLALVVAGMLVVLVLQNRDAAANWLSHFGEAALLPGEDRQAQSRVAASPAQRGLRMLRERLAQSWHLLVILYIGAIYSVWALGIPGGFSFLLQASVLSVLILSVAGSLAYGLRRALNRRFAISERLRLRFPMLEARANRYLPLLLTAINSGIWIIAAFSLLQAWGFDALGWLHNASGQRLLASAITIAIISLVALLSWEVVSYLIERAIERARVVGDADQNARIMTLLPLARRTFLLVLVIMVVLMVLSEFGINIAPLLAGAGVIGLAIGFGAQTLVKDVITGLFILIENTIAVGDYIDVGGHEGTVEYLSIRSVRLRDAAANVHTVPFSEVSSVLNYTRDYSYAVLNIGVAYRENVDEVMEVIKEIGDDLLADPDQAPVILEPLQVQGVNALEDSAVVIRARIKVKAGNQWAMRRHFNRLVKNRFDALGIEIPFPHQTLYFGVDAQGQAPPAQVVIRQPGDAGAAPPQPAARRKHKPKRKPPRDPTDDSRRITDHDIDQGGGVD